MFGRNKDSDENTTDAQVSQTPKPASIIPKTTPNTFQSRSAAMIGQTIKIKGTITGSENLVIEGQVEGSVDLKGNDLTIGENGQVSADLAAKVVNVQGQVDGDISGSEKVVVSKTGRVTGNITAPRVTLEDGAKFKGSIDMDPGDSAKVSAPKATPAAQSAPSENADKKEAITS